MSRAGPRGQQAALGGSRASGPTGARGGGGGGAAASGMHNPSLPRPPHWDLLQTGLEHKAPAFVRSLCLIGLGGCLWRGRLCLHNGACDIILPPTVMSEPPQWAFPDRWPGMGVPGHLQLSPVLRAGPAEPGRPRLRPHKWQPKKKIDFSLFKSRCLAEFFFTRG